MATASIRHSPLLVRNVPEGTEEEDLDDVFKTHGWEVRRRPDGTPDIVITGNRAVVTLTDANFLAGVLSKSGQVDLGVTQLAFSTANNTPQKVVNHIRSTWGVGATVSPADEKLLNAQRIAINEALKPLADEAPAHLLNCLLELLQNADDNDYKPGTTPALEVLVRENQGKTEHQLQLINNEAGFQEANVYALCGLNLTTKAHAGGGYIGEHNLHFKAVFAASSTPTIVSNSYAFQFKFNATESLSYVIPHWLTAVPPSAKAGATNVILPLKPKVLPTVMDNLRKLQAPLLIFMRKLRNIKIDVNDGDPITLQRVDAATGRVQVTQQSKAGKTTAAFTLLEQDYSIPLNMKQTRNCPGASITRLALAFPHDASGTQPLYAYLPVADFGFRFIIQGDFEFPGARTELASTPWNLWLRGAIPSLFQKAVTRLQSDEDFGTTFYQFVPLRSEVTSPFFKSVVETILDNLRKTECVLADDGRWVAPDTIFFPPTGFLHEMMAQGGVIDAAGKSFVNAAVDLTNPKIKEVLTALGVTEFTMSQFLGFLTNKKFLEGKPIEFLSRLYSTMTQLIAEGSLKAEEVKPIPLLLLKNNALVAPEKMPMFMPPGGFTVTHEFENTVPLLHPAFIGDESAMQLFEQLGLKEVNPETIMFDWLLPNMATMTTDELIVATQYVKDKTDIATQEQLRAKGFLLVTAEGKLVKSTELLLPSPYSPYQVQEIFGNSMGFVTTAYVPAPPLVQKPPTEEIWASWRTFFMRLGASLLFQIVRTPSGGYTCPNVQRVLEPGPFTRMQQLQLRAQLCMAISKLWDYIEPFTHTPKEPVTLFWRTVQMSRWLPGSDGRLHRPCDQFLYLRTKTIETLMKGSVVYLQAEVTLEVAKALGVLTEVPPELLVDKLATSVCTSEIYKDIYTSLETNWDRCSPRVRGILMNMKIIRISGKLYSAKEMVWSDQSGMLNKIPSVQTHFPALQKFFVEYLRVPLSPSLQHFMAELDLIRDPPKPPKPPKRPEDDDDDEDAPPPAPEEPPELTPEQIEKVRRLYYGMAHTLVLQPDSNLAPLTQKPVFLTHRGEWVMHPKVLLNDQPHRFTGLGDQPDIHFWDVPLECIPKVQAITAALGIPTLTTLKPIGGAPDPKAIARSDYLTKQVRSLVPYLLRYVFYRHHAHYVALKKPAKYLNTQVWTAKSLPATYEFNGVQWSAELPWFLKDDAEEAHILVGGDPERTLPRALAECFGASPLTIMGMLAAKTPGNLNTMLVDMGVGDLPPTELSSELREAAEAGREAAAGQKRAADDDVVAGPVVKRVCLPTEAPRKITIINANSVKEVDAHRDEVPHMNTAEAREQMKVWGQQYVMLLLTKSGMKDVARVTAAAEASSYDVTWMKDGMQHHGLVYCTFEPKMPQLILTPKQWQAALKFGNRHHVFVIRNACTKEATVTQLTDPAALVGSGKWPCHVLFSPQA